METKDFMIIDGIPVEIGDEKNLLQMIRKAGIELPTFCYHSELSIYGACRMCIIEDSRGNLDAACSAQPWPGMEIRTNTQRLRKYRKMILELLLSNHCRDCTVCERNGNCKLQDLARRFNVDAVRFKNTATEPVLDDSSPCIVKDQSKCILCGDCVRVCDEVQKVGAIDFAGRGSNMTISTAFDEPLSESNCVGCGQCAAVCPTGALVIKNDTELLWKELDNRDIKVTVQIAPAVRVALGKQFGLSEGENAMGKIVAALRRLGFDEVFDTSTGADMTVLEEANELLGRLDSEAAKSGLPLFTSCCPAWVTYCEKNYPELMPHVSTCRSPMQMLASVIKERDGGNKEVHVAVMPCTAKKFESKRKEFEVNGVPRVDYVITTQELINMIKEAGLVFEELEAEAVDSPFGTRSGAGVIFGVTGGVTEAVLRYVSSDKSTTALQSIALQGVRGMQGVKEATVKVGDKELRIAVVSGLGNVKDLIERIKGGERFDFVECMACTGGCVSGAGQPYAPAEDVDKRGKGLYSADKMCSFKSAEENPLVKSLYDGVLKGRSHELLHVHYADSAK